MGVIFLLRFTENVPKSWLFFKEKKKSFRAKATTGNINKIVEWLSID